MKFSTFAEYLKKLEDTPSRLKITEILAGLFKEAETDEVDKICYLSLGILAPNYKGVVFNLAEKMMLEAVTKAYGKDLGNVKRGYKKLGDLGDLAEELAKSEKIKKKSNLSVNEMYDKLYKLAVDEGEGSQDRKIDAVVRILQTTDPLSARFIARIPVGKLRLGFSDKTILDALSWMETGGKGKKSLLEKAYEVTPDVGLLAKSVKQKGIDETAKNAKPVVGIPVLPMLAQRLKSPKEMIEKMGRVAIEPKFDGLRVLIHFKKGEFVKAFTRNMNNVTEMFPELSKFHEVVNADSVIFDTEAVGMDPTMQILADFQTTMKRRRVHQIDITAKSIPLSFQVFDVLLVDSENFMNKTYEVRRKKLRSIVKKGNKLLVVDDYKITKDVEVITEIHRQKLAEGLEGVIVKKVDSEYIPGRTGWRWVKMKGKEENVGKLADTVDCVVMGYYRGRGKRASFGLGGFLVGVVSESEKSEERKAKKEKKLSFSTHAAKAIRVKEAKEGEKEQSEAGKILTLTKIGTGLTDDQFKDLKKRLTKIESEVKPKEYGKVDKTITPDVWVEPSLVVEIAADEITKSPIHSSGYALRFPRLVKFRDDKGVDQSTTGNEIKKLYKLQ